jgi:hypothetical protein
VDLQQRRNSRKISPCRRQIIHNTYLHHSYQSWLNWRAPGNVGPSKVHFEAVFSYFHFWNAPPDLKITFCGATPTHRPLRSLPHTLTSPFTRPNSFIGVTPHSWTAQNPNHPRMGPFWPLYNGPYRTGGLFAHVQNLPTHAWQSLASANHSQHLSSSFLSILAQLVSPGERRAVKSQFLGCFFVFSLRLERVAGPENHLLWRHTDP